MSPTTAAMYFLEDAGSFFCRQASQQRVRIGLLIEGAYLHQEAGGSSLESGGFPPIIWETSFFYPFSDRGPPVYSCCYGLDGQEGSCFREILYSDTSCPAILDGTRNFREAISFDILLSRYLDNLKLVETGS
ncbi:UNVERIFIED_CONTAM: hypothetical protein Sradi_5628800 [Sesamum radiatum]|uniref:Uncharacterized protein n=1 Tax=Sesamum radiatum TaxID=300843 RepID=A0AAW2L232_SESRA